MALAEQDLIDIRRFCGYPAKGGVPVQAFGYRFFQWYGTLEFRMNNLSATEESTVTATYLTNLRTLETALMDTSANLDTAQAGPWQHNANEHRDRMKLFTDYCRRLCSFFGVPPGPNFQDDQLRFIV